MSLAAGDETRSHDDEMVGASARRLLEDLFVTVPDAPEANLDSVARALDSVHGRTSGRVSSRSFFLTRHSLLDGRAPIDVIGEPDGPRRIWQLVDAVVDSYS